MKKQIIPLLIILPATQVYSATLLNETFDPSPTYDEGFFNGSDSGSNPDDFSSISSSLNPTGGNPDGHLAVDHHHELERFAPVGTDFQTTIQSYFDITSFVYDASTSGPLEVLSFSVDVFFTDLPSLTVYLSVSDSDGGNFASFQSVPASPTGGWQTVTATGLDQTDFPSRDFTNGTDLMFGFGFITDAFIPVDDETFTILADNLIVGSDPVPEPSTSIMLFGLLIPVLRRKR